MQRFPLSTAAERPDLVEMDELGIQPLDDTALPSSLLDWALGGLTLGRLLFEGLCLAFGC